MKTKSLLLALGLLSAGIVVGQSFVPATITLTADELRYRASLYHNLAYAIEDLSEIGAARAFGRADAYLELADRAERNALTP